MTKPKSDIVIYRVLRILGWSHYDICRILGLSLYVICCIIMFVALLHTYVCRQLWRLSLVGLVAASWMIWLFRFIFGGGPCMLVAHCVSLFPKFYTVLNSSSFPKIQYTTECRWDKVTWSGTACAFFPQYILDSVVFSKWAPKYTTEQFTVLLRHKTGKSCIYLNITV